jgi:hypothetical protein
MYFEFRTRILWFMKDGKWCRKRGNGKRFFFPVSRDFWILIDEARKNILSKQAQPSSEALPA